MMSLDHQCELK